ncbi:hypothetical protein [Chitinophaga sp. S165]|uniref:hypothetical protein n=1 Tax=Chitinophaga sp. S165 TaxID=2135462 RepID=UPI000D7102EB|nr:hypothetical protein [Chitinophaga sp. S165]PWV46123.1 hypothetical protein C7475_11125 [Chitinophaga sp. S165]
MINITFHIYLAGGETWDDTTPLPAQLFDGAVALEGVLRIFDNGILTNEIEDELPALIRNLCFSVSRDLQHQDHAAYHFHSYFGQIDFSKQGEHISVAGKGINTVTYDAQDLIGALQNCGERFVSLLEQLKDTVEEKAPIDSMLEAIRLPG